MKTSTKALLLSALVFPGAGYLLFNRRLPFLVIAVVVFVALTIVLQHAFTIATEISNDILAGNIPFDTVQITKIISERSNVNSPIHVRLASWSLLVVWVGGIFDTWRLGRQLND